MRESVALRGGWRARLLGGSAVGAVVVVALSGSAEADSPDAANTHPADGPGLVAPAPPAPGAVEAATMRWLQAEMGGFPAPPQGPGLDLAALSEELAEDADVPAPSRAAEAVAPSQTAARPVPAGQTSTGTEAPLPNEPVGQSAGASQDGPVPVALSPALTVPAEPIAEPAEQVAALPDAVGSPAPGVPAAAAVPDSALAPASRADTIAATPPHPPTPPAVPSEQVAAAGDAGPGTPADPAPVPAQPVPPQAPAKAAPVTTVRTVPEHGSAAAPAPPPQVTTNDVTLNLIHLLVQQKIITAKQADALFQQARQQAGASASRPAAAGAPPAPTTPAPAAAIQATSPPATPPGPAPSVRVTYVPESVKQEIKEATKQELIAEGKLPTAAQDVLPEWLRKIKFSGDFRFRYERLLYDGANSNQFINFNALAASSTPFDISANQTSFPPLLDTTEDRERLRVRARLQMLDDVSNDVTVAMRFSTGVDNNPVSPNQTLGNAFNKYDIVLDRAYLDYHPLSWAQFRVGRFPNPWFATDLMWYSDLSFDGAAVELAGEASSTLRPFLTAGAFPVQNTALDFPTYDETKQASRDKWLYAAQAGLSWLPSRQFLVKLGAAYYDYVNLEGKESTPCLAVLVSIACNTDNSRPAFLQMGNTLFGIRDIVIPTNTTSPSEYQYFGLATPFRDIDVSGRIDWAVFNPTHLILDGEFAMNLAYNKAKIIALGPVNNLNSDNKFAGGNIAYMAKLTFGRPEIKRLGDWNVSAAYKFLESDSLVDAFTDPDFHEGGTNAKGYIAGFNIGLATDVWMTARYLSATEITGPPLSVDVIQVDLNARF